jgi:RIO kinase 2
MADHEYVPIDAIGRLSKLSAGKVNSVTKRLHDFGLIQRSMETYVGYTMNYSGYDCLALKALVNRGSLEALGKPIGVGKESDVLEGLAPVEGRVAVKFYRLGRTSFRQVRRKRNFGAGRSAWMFKSKIAAEKEFQALKLTFQSGVSVPEPLDQNRHMVVTMLVVGAPLAVYSEMPDPEGVLDELLENVRKAYTVAGVVNADLSEYNVLVRPDGHVFIIDWPQFVMRSHPNASMLLERDLKNILSYFRRKFGVRREFDEILKLVVEENN